MSTKPSENLKLNDEPNMVVKMPYRDVLVSFVSYTRKETMFDEVDKLEIVAAIDFVLRKLDETFGPRNIVGTLKGKTNVPVGKL